MKDLRQFNKKEIIWDMILAIFIGVGLYLDFVHNLTPIVLLPILVFIVRFVIINGKFYASCDTSEKIQTLRDYVKKDMEKRFAWALITIVLFVITMIWLSFASIQSFVYLSITFTLFSVFRSMHKSFLWITSRHTKLA